MTSTIVEMKLGKELTQEKFAGFLEWLSPGGESAGDEYERLRFRLCTFFSQRRCRFPEELTDETINRVIVKIGEEDVRNKLAYCYGVAKNVYRESLRKERNHLNVDEVHGVAHAPQEPAFPAECLDRCLAKLPDESSRLILEYFSEARTAKIELHRCIA